MKSKNNYKITFRSFLIEASDHEEASKELLRRISENPVSIFLRTTITDVKKLPYRGGK